jgi:DNA (cytosine-5)-methyltransferase 1
MKVLNLYAGIGGNRKLWTDVDVTAVEIDPQIAAIYQDYFPDDTVIIGDAHQYLLDHYKEFDFIWASPPCPSHSDMRRCATHRGQQPAVYPDMELYQEIILLQYFAPIKGKYVVENVIPYYDFLIPPDSILHRHAYWSNFKIGSFEVTDKRKHNDIKAGSNVYGFNLDKYNIKNKVKILRNMVDPELSNYILNCARNIITKSNINQLDIFEK